MSSRHARRIRTPVPYLRKLTLSAGVITDVTRLAGVEGDGRAYPDSSVGVWPAATNLATQSIPGALATTGVTKAGDAAATLTKVADSTHPFPNATADVWCLDNSAGAGDATVDFNGNATAAAHTASIWAYKTAGSPNLSIEGTSPTAISGATWARYTNTKTATAGDNLRITAPAGAVVYFVAAQLETGSIATPYIKTDGGTASRAAGSVDGIRAAALDETQMWYMARVRVDSTQTGSGRIFSFGDSANERLEMIITSSTNRATFQRVAGGVGSTATAASGTIAVGDTAFYFGGVSATNVYAASNGAALTAAANTSIPVLASTGASIGKQNWANFGYPGVSVLWAAVGRGLPTDALSALGNSWGNNDPLPHMFPHSAQLTFLAPFNGGGTDYRYAA